MEHSDKIIRKWAEIIYDSNSEIAQELSADPNKYIEKFIFQNAESLYKNMGEMSELFQSHFTLNKEFSKLTEDERMVWYDFAADIPYKLASLHVLIRPFKDFCRTCIITEGEVENLARIDHSRQCNAKFSKGWKYGKKLNIGYKTDPSLVSFHQLPAGRKRFYLELNYLIPAQVKKCGFEIIRPEEIADIDNILIQKLSRAIHSGYLSEARKQEVKDSANRNFISFDDLPDEIRFSNMDNAWHIPTKLLSIGYKIRPVEKGMRASALCLNEAEIETMAMVEHLRWCWDKRLNGWTYGKKNDLERKTHPSLLPYENLSESEKEKDRKLVKLIPALLQDMHFEAYPISPGRIKKLSYAIKPQSMIHRLLHETRELHSQIDRLASTSPDLKEKLQNINKKIEETIHGVTEDYNYAQHIQETFLPGDLYIRECFPESFVLYKPKDIVSGDFYFFSKQDHLMIFAAADCTGHGIPGALLSTISYGMLDQAVNELKLTEPSVILEHLYSRIHRFLRRNEEGTSLSDDMDIVLCTLDMRTNILNLSGVSIPLHRITGSELITYWPRNFDKGYNENIQYQFVSENIQLIFGDTLYLGSDGYTDQFGGSQHKKYMSSRFKSLIKSIRNHSMPEQCDMLYEEIERWREKGNAEQTDDILVIGIRI
jgi:serine phosphatase RsbU (regulator of sigma subunit)